MSNLQTVIEKLVSIEGSQQNLAEKLDVTANYVSMLKNGKRLLSEDVALKIQSVYGINAAELLQIQGLEKLGLKKSPATDFLNGLKPLPEKPKLDNTDKAEDIIRRKKGSVSEDGRVINESELVEATEIKLPIAGQAGLSSKMYPDELIEEFETYTIKVRPSERGKYYLIEANGNSMPPLIQHGDWLRCSEVSKMFWQDDNFFKPDKIYCIWHNERGILFKRIVYRELGQLWCVSDNTDKVRYPDFELELKECTKILHVVELAKRKFK